MVAISTILGLYVLIHLGSCSDSESPLMDPIIFPKKFTLGSRVQLMCMVNHGSLPMTITWTKNGVRVIGEGQKMQINKVNDYTSLLIIPKLDADHIGNYTCEAINPFGSDRHIASIYLEVPPSMMVSPSDIDTLRGNSAYLHCNAKGFPIPKVAWLLSDINKDKVGLRSDGKRKIFQNGTLLINDVQVDDSGKYTCEVDNGVGQKLTASAFLKVHEPPLMITEFQPITSKKGQMTKIKCSAKGEIPIIWEWLKAGTHLPVFHGDRLEATEEIKAAFVTSELVIRDTKTEDAAVYECKARNKFGETSGTAELTVLEPPDAPKDVKVTEVGSRFSRLSWRPPYSGNSPVIHYKVRYWTNDGKGRRLQEIHIPGEVSCHLQNIHPGTRYHVAVVAENSVGAGNPSNPVDFMTKEEEPSAAPTDVVVHVVDSTSLKVTWKAPPKDSWNGRLTSFQVGFRQHGVELAYRFEMVRIREQKSSDLTLSGLQQSTRYDVIVRAINAAGNGPWSPEMSAYTSSGNPPATPILRIVSSTSHTLQIEWDVHGLNKPDHVKQFVLEYGKAGKMSEKVHIPGSKRKLLLRGLEGNIRYELRMASYNEHGLSAFSPTVSETTMDFQSEAMTQENEATPFYLRLYFIVPVAVSVTVVVSTLVVAWACVARTRALESASHLLRETPYDYCAKMPLAPQQQQQQQQLPTQMPINSSTLRPEHRPPALEEAYDLPWDMTLNDGSYTRLQNGDGRRTIRAEHNRRSR